LFVAGGIAALLLIAAIVVAVADGGRRVSAAASEATAKPIPTPSVAETDAAVVAVRPLPPPDPIMPLDEPLALEAETSPCFGTCSRARRERSISTKRSRPTST